MLCNVTENKHILNRNTNQDMIQVVSIASVLIAIKLWYYQYELQMSCSTTQFPCVRVASVPLHSAAMSCDESTDDDLRISPGAWPEAALDI